MYNVMRVLFMAYVLLYVMNHEQRIMNKAL